MKLPPGVVITWEILDLIKAAEKRAGEELIDRIRLQALVDQQLRGKHDGSLWQTLEEPESAPPPPVPAGPSATVEYRTWNAMKQRCNPVYAEKHPNHAGRGIRVCAGWLESFESFLADMGQKPAPDLSIDRIDNDRGYDCGHCADCVKRGATKNCRWADARTQRLNQRPHRVRRRPSMQSGNGA